MFAGFSIIQHHRCAFDGLNLAPSILSLETTMDLETRYYLRRKMYCSAEFAVLELLTPLNNYVADSLGMENTKAEP